MDSYKKGKLAVAGLALALAIPFVASYSLFQYRLSRQSQHQSSDKPSFSAEILDLHSGIKEDNRYHLDGTISWQYLGEERINGPIDWGYSFCISDAVCVAGGFGKSIDALVSGTSITESFHLKPSDVVGKRPHFTIFIRSPGDTEEYHKDLSMQLNPNKGYQ